MTNVIGTHFVQKNQKGEAMVHKVDADKLKPAKTCDNITTQDPFPVAEIIKNDTPEIRGKTSNLKEEGEAASNSGTDTAKGTSKISKQGYDAVNPRKKGKNKSHTHRREK